MEIKNVLLGIVIAVIFFMFCVYGTKLMYKEPAYNDFCNASYPYPETAPNQSCSFNPELQQKINDCSNQNGIPRYEYDSSGCENSLICDLCNSNFTNAQQGYFQNLFLISLIIGLVIIAFSVIIIKVSAVSGGLMFGSLMFIIYGTAGYWQFMNDFLRFGILGAVLVILIWLAYYLAKKNSKIKNKIKRKK